FDVTLNLDDNDGDGQNSCAGDCDDFDPGNFLGNVEVCDGFDNDCNFLADADGAGEVDVDLDLSLSCDDCDDADEFNFPGNSEVCDGQDNDCDASTEAGDGESDDDGDGVINCDDCADNDPNVQPGATEFCDGLDTNCDGAVANVYATAPLTSGGVGSDRLRGNIFLASQNTLLNGFAMELNASAGEVLTFAVYSGASATSLTLVDSHTVEVAPANDGVLAFHNSLPFNLELETGTYYGFGVQWSPSTSYNWQSPVSFPVALPWGTHEAGIETNQAALPSALTNDNNTLSYRMTVTTDDEADFDTDGTIFPTQLEVCDDVDNDCTGLLNDGNQVLTDAPNLSVPPTGTSGSMSVTQVAFDGGAITDVIVTLDISHTFTGDLEITLISPEGTTIDLTSDNGGTGNNFTNTVFDDSAATSITTISSSGAPFTGSYQPEEPLSTFNGENASGIWTLVVNDDALGDVGNLNSWTLDMVTDMSDGSQISCPGIDCDDILDGNASAQDGIYWIDPTGVNPWQAFCDMTSDGGGWTLVANVDDLNDPFFGGATTGPYYQPAWVDAWEGTGTRNVNELPTYVSDITTSTKYSGWSEISASDLKVEYKNDGAFFLCENLSATQPLSTSFATTPGSDTCAVTCGTWSQDRLSSDIPSNAGLNCNDGNQAWYTGSAPAENARIGGRLNGAVMVGFLGAMGDRSPASTPYERTWWGQSEAGVAQDSNVMVFVR
ncbi:MAG: proprotein convertase P-domain-containing protein, partial [Deltaproteobacteria bacterium]|nr:proprotein convertase P-domain-containing protein [Deltaproteobacteria bacterium]